MEIHQPRGGNPGGYLQSCHESSWKRGKGFPKDFTPETNKPVWDLRPPKKKSYQQNASERFKQKISPNSRSPVITFTAPTPSWNVFSRGWDTSTTTPQGIIVLPRYSASTPFPYSQGQMQLLVPSQIPRIWSPPGVAVKIGSNTTQTNARLLPRLGFVGGKW